MRSRIAAGRPAQELGAERVVGAGCCAKSVAHAPRRARAAVEAGRRTSRPAAHEEVTGHADAVELEPAATPDLEHDDAQRDRDAETAVEHVVEERVAGIAVVGRVAAEPSDTNSEVDSSPAENPARTRRERVESREPGVDVEIGVGVRGDERARPRRARSRAPGAP